MTLARTKTMYSTNFGLGPYVKELLQNQISESPFIAVSYDESLNDVLQKGQLDFIIRYWDESASRVSTRYWNSTFLGHAKVADLKENYHAGIERINASKIMQISMDGPNVNLALYKELVAERKELNLSGFLDIGSCNLHTVHNAFKVGAQKTDWNIKHVLSGAFWTFKDSPARRADYISLNNSNVFPMSFTEHAGLRIGSLQSGSSIFGRISSKL